MVTLRRIVSSDFCLPFCPFSPSAETHGHGFQKGLCSSMLGLKAVRLPGPPARTSVVRHKANVLWSKSYRVIGDAAVPWRSLAEVAIPHRRFQSFQLNVIESTYHITEAGHHPVYEDAPNLCGTNCWMERSVFAHVQISSCSTTGQVTVPITRGSNPNVWVTPLN